MTTSTPSPAPAPRGKRRHRLWRPAACAVAGLAAALLWQGAAPVSGRAADTVVIPAPAQDEAAGSARVETAVVAGGCFWGVQGVFQHLQGVRRVVAGYAGGTADTATYATVSSGQTGHAESVEITFDPRRVSYGTVLQVFFSVVHDPTEVNRQGPDSGPQYRSAIFPTTAEQRRVAQAYIVQLDASHVFGAPIATRIEDRKSFYPAETYHQDYLARHPDNPYIVINDLPKVAELKRRFPDRYRDAPVLLGAAASTAARD